jgi:hypothetical protein
MFKSCCHGNTVVIVTLVTQVLPNQCSVSLSLSKTESNSTKGNYYITI